MLRRLQSVPAAAVSSSITCATTRALRLLRHTRPGHRRRHRSRHLWSGTNFRRVCARTTSRSAMGDTGLLFSSAIPGGAFSRRVSGFRLIARDRHVLRLRLKSFIFRTSAVGRNSHRGPAFGRRDDPFTLGCAQSLDSTLFFRGISFCSDGACRDENLTHAKKKGGIRNNVLGWKAPARRLSRWPDKPAIDQVETATSFARLTVSQPRGGIRGVYHRAGPPGPDSGRPDGRLRPDPVAIPP